MSTADDLVVVIVEDDKKKGRVAKQRGRPAKHLKQIDKTNQIDMLLDAAERLGSPVKLEDVQVKQEVIDEDYEGIEYLDEEYIIPDVVELKPVSKKEPVTDDENDDNVDVINDYEAGVHRYKMLKANERHSYVNDIRKQRPDIAKDKKALVEEISKLMMQQTKPPEVPPSVFETSMDPPNFQCNLCGAEKKTQMGATRHYQEKHGPRYLVCYACGVDFRSLTNLYKHEKRCSAPDSTLVLKARALVVMRRDPTRPFALPKREFEKAKPRFPCSYCDSIFTSKVGMEAHERVHRGERPFQCNHCAAAYSSAPALKRHMTSHEGRRFECDTCGFNTYNKSTLATHVAVHMPNKKFSCTVAGCPKRYATKAAMLFHVDSVHLRLPPSLPCQICHKRFRKTYTLKKHMLKVHKMQIVTKKMFYKKLPKMASTEVSEAKVVFTDDSIISVGQDEMCVTDVSVLREEILKELNNSNDKQQKKSPRPKAVKKTRGTAGKGRKINNSVTNTVQNKQNPAADDDTWNKDDAVNTAESRVYLNVESILDDNTTPVDNIGNYIEINNTGETVRPKKSILVAHNISETNRNVIVEPVEDSMHSMDSDEYLDMADGSCEVINSAESFKKLLKTGDKYQVYVIEDGQVTKKVNFDDIKDTLMEEYMNK